MKSLPGMAALEGYGAVAALALPPELSRMDVVLLMARNAIG
jgi:hypothetical protein